MKRLVFALACSGFLAGAANAQILVIGNSLGKDCFNAAKFSDGPASAQERTCTKAINSGTLDRRNLTATYVNRGIIRMRKKDFDGANEDYMAAEELNPSYGAIYLNQGAARIGAGEPAEAIPLLKKSLELDTQQPHVAHYNLGLAYDMTGQLTEAYYAFSDALELKPEWELAQSQIDRYILSTDG